MKDREGYNKGGDKREGGLIIDVYCSSDELSEFIFIFL